jgi:hypothetical protein
MTSVWESFRDCGSPAFLVAFLAGVGILASGAGLGVILGARERRLRIAMAVVVLTIGLAAVGAGVVGKMIGRARTEQAIAMMGGSSAIGPTMRAQILEEGYYESEQCVSVGLGGGAIPLISGALLLAFAVFVKKK